MTKQIERQILALQELERETFVARLEAIRKAKPSVDDHGWYTVRR